MTSLLIACLFLNSPVVQDGKDKAVDPADPKGRFGKFEQNHKLAAAHVWHDESGWHLRFRGAEGVKVQFLGKIVLDTEVPQLKGGQKEKDDKITKVTNGIGFNYKTHGYGYDAIDFYAPQSANRVTFEIKIGGNDDPKRIFIGAKGGHPKSSIFTLPAHPEK